MADLMIDTSLVPEQHPVSRDEWEKIPEADKRVIILGVHREILKQMEPRIRENLVYGLRIGLAPSDVVVLVMHKLDPIVPKPVRDAHPPKENYLVMLNRSREVVASFCETWSPEEGAAPPYRGSEELFRRDIAPNEFTAAVFYFGHVSAIHVPLDDDQLALIRAMGPLVPPDMPQEVAGP